MDKYVAFLDILGFKNALREMSHIEAQEYIRVFSKTIYDVYERYNYSKVKGYVVSDSLIVYTEDDSSLALNNMINIISEICQEEFKENNILIRGAVAKGNFERMEAHELSNLRKGLIVGDAYVETYTLENAIKAIGIILTESVYEDYVNYNDNTDNLIDENGYKVLRYLTIDYLLDSRNLKKYVELANNSNWLPHYYNTIYFSLLNVRNSNKAIQLFDNIIELIGKDESSKGWRNTDSFIKNAFNENVYWKFQKRFLKYIRSYIIG